MDEFGTIQDYSMIDAFISQNLADFNKKLFGERDEQTGYYDEVDNEDESGVESTDEITPDEPMEDTGPESMSPEDIYDYLFGPEDQRPYSPVQSDDEQVSQPYNGDIRSSGTFGTQNIGNQGKQIYGEVANFLGYSPVANSIYRSKEYNDKLIAQGKPASKNSYHLSGNAVDFKPSDWNKLSAQQKAYMKKNYDVIYHDNHYHVEPKQAGGTPVASTAEQQFVGLNNEALETLFLPLQGTNPIRGLDNGQPVFVEDDMGNSQVLYGPDDVAYMTGGVYEKRLPKKYKNRK